MRQTTCSQTENQQGFTSFKMWRDKVWVCDLRQGCLLVCTCARGGQMGAWILHNLKIQYEFFLI